MNMVRFVIVFLCVAIGIVHLYFIDTSLRDYINLHINCKESHRYIIDNKTFFIPLPPKTVSKYRTSDKSAVYISRSDLNEIVAFYRNVSDKFTSCETKNDNSKLLLLEYNAHRFSVVIEEYGKWNKLIVGTEDTTVSVQIQ